MNRKRLAFTLIEMLTVIAIIGILAGILIPTIGAAMKKTRMAQASADISALAGAVSSYTLDFGAPPPDTSANIGAPFPATLNPNECMMWYLTMQYSPGSPAVGYPANWSVPPASDPNGGWSPSTASVVFSRTACGPYFDIKAKQKTDRDGNGFYEFNDPWARPYLYRASTPQFKASLSGGVITIDVTPSDYGTGWPMPYTSTGSTWNAAGLNHVVGQITLSDATNGVNNGTFAFTGTGDNTLTLNGNPPVVNSGNLQVTFPLHNRQTCDIYSLGPYGLTRAASMPANGEWKPTHGGNPMDNTSLDVWLQVWGTPGDGNDIDSTTGNVLINSIYQDNICNWK